MGASAGSGPASGSRQIIDYLGHAFTVPASRRVVDLTKNPDACVLFDTTVGYLGTPGTQEDCPASGAGRNTEAMLIQPSAAAPPISVEDTTSRQVTVVGQGVRSTASYTADDSRIVAVIRSAGIAEDTRSYVGLGFDTCDAPTTGQMTAWGASPYRAIGIYIGGSDRECAQSFLTASWVQTESQAGWHLLPLYGGPQVANGTEATSPAAQGTAAADDAIGQAGQLGIGVGAVLHYDMEVGSTPYTAAETAAGDTFLAAWTTELHRLGYLSGLYGDESGSIGAQIAGWGSIVEPDAIDVGNGNALQNDDPGADPNGDWNGRRVHQFAGDGTQTFGGVQLAVDEDYFALTAVGPACDQAPQPTSPTGGPVRSGPIICNNPQLTP